MAFCDIVLAIVPTAEGYVVCQAASNDFVARCLRLRCAKTAEYMKVLFGVDSFGSSRNVDYLATELTPSIILKCLGLSRRQ